MFVSQNYTQIQNLKTGEWIQLEPGRPFDASLFKDKEVAEQYKEIKVYTDGKVEIEALGVFKNGDVEVRYIDGSLCYRIPATTFANNFTEVQDKVTLGLDMLKGKTPKEIADQFTVDTLRVLARKLKIRGASQMNEDKLVDKLIEKLGE